MFFCNSSRNRLNFIIISVIQVYNITVSKCSYSGYGYMYKQNSVIKSTPSNNVFLHFIYFTSHIKQCEKRRPFDFKKIIGYSYDIVLQIYYKYSTFDVLDIVFVLAE